jgi:hypothetical protein
LNGPLASGGESFFKKDLDHLRDTSAFRVGFRLE